MIKYNIELQHAKGKLHAIERINLLLDKESFQEIGSQIVNYNQNEGKALPYDGVITGYGTINGNIVYIYSQDFTVNGGTLGYKHGKKISHVIELAIKKKCPIIGINDSGGARIQEGVNALAGYGEVFYSNTKASGYIPQISIISGPCAGGAVYSPGITDFIFVIDKISNMFVTGPKVVESVCGQKCTAQELGGAMVHSEKSGVAHFYHSNEEDCYQNVRKLITILSTNKYETLNHSNNLFHRVFNSNKKSKINEIVPNESNKTYDVKKVINEIFDKGSFFEVQEYFAKNIVIGFGKLNDVVVGIVASQPAYMGGVLDCDSSDKGARFVRFCDAFDIPLVTFVDVPGFLPGLQQEHRGIIRHGAKLLYAYAEATTIKLTVILRKAYGGAYIAMCSKHLRADYVYAWSGAEVAVMGAEGAVPLIYNKQIRALEAEAKREFIETKINEYNKKYMNASTALAEGYIDEVLLPEETRDRLYQDIMSLYRVRDGKRKTKKHGCIPL